MANFALKKTEPQGTQGMRKERQGKRLCDLTTLRPLLKPLRSLRLKKK
jgi:hypothetical protein